MLKSILFIFTRKEMLIYFKICCDDIKYRLLKQKKETKQLRKNTCCWYIETKLVIFFSAVYMYLLTLKMSVLRRNNKCIFCWAWRDCRTGPVARVSSWNRSAVTPCRDSFDHPESWGDGNGSAVSVDSSLRGQRRANGVSLFHHFL